MLRNFVMKFRQLIVLSVISAFALSAQAAFVTGMSRAQIEAGVAAQQAAGNDFTAVVANGAAVQPLAAPLTSLAVPTTQTLCSASCR
jgi:hypothetical protein